MRWQPNYQRLALTFLIQLKLILNHDDPQCTDLALKWIRWTFCVSEWGDSHKCYPVDLLQEHSMVEQVKKVGRRSPTAYLNLQSRVLLHSYIGLKDIESRAKENNEFGPMSSDRIKKADEKCRMSNAILKVWLSILNSICPLQTDCNATDMDVIQGFGDEETQVLFADRSRAYYKSIDAIDHILEAASAFLKGFRNGCEVALPTRQYSIVRRRRWVCFGATK
mmetsp:Transcript_41822/g.71546  ORF Transcript_41822/g.71546 Transcript_41822/m.71546 type:complete len:222 (+) Transcript_41822:1282-1947(+)